MVTQDTGQWVSPFCQTGPPTAATFADIAKILGVDKLKSATGQVAFAYDVVNLDFGQYVNIGSAFDQVPERYQTWFRQQSFYLQDKWTPTKKLVINAGLRFASEYGWEPATCQEATPFIAAQCFPAIESVPDYWNVVPRFSAVYDVAGDGKTALKFAANRYNVLTALSTINRVNPVQTASDTRAWTVCAAGQTSGCDLNRDLLPQVNELGASNGFPAGAANRYATDLKPPVANEYSVEF